MSNRRPAIGPRNAHIAVVCGLVGLVVVLSISPLRGQGQPSNDRLTNLEKRQDIVVDAMKNYYERGLWFLGIIAAFVALQNLLRYFQDQRFVSLQEQQFKNITDLGKAYADNIRTANDLMKAVEGAVTSYAGAQKAMERVTELERLRANETSRWADNVRALNDSAVALCARCRRNSHNDPEIQQLVRDFSAKYQALAQGTARVVLNANAHFILGLYARIDGRDDAAIEAFEQAVSTAESDKKSDGSSYSGRGTTPLEVWLRKLQNISAFTIGVLRSNLGDYLKAKEAFEQARTYDPADYEAATYIPEVMYLGKLALIPAIDQEFERVIQAVTTLDAAETKSFTSSRERLLSMLYLKRANCYMGADPAFRDLDAAERYVSRSLELDPLFSFAQLAKAQLLRERGTSEAEQRSLALQVFEDAKNTVSRTTDTKTLLMHYAIMTICCAIGAIKNELPSFYAMRTYELAATIPLSRRARMRIFSPISKVDLTVDAFITEVRNFESDTAPRTDALAVAAASGMFANRTGRREPPRYRR